MARKATGTSQPKAESITVRLDPKIRYGLELMTRKQRRTLSSVVEWALLKAMESEDGGLIEKLKEGEIFNPMTTIWDTEEADRFYNLAAVRPAWLNFEEEKLQKTIIESDYFEALRENNKHLCEPETGYYTFPYHQKMREDLREHFETFKKVASGELGKEALPKPPRPSKKQNSKVQGGQ